MVTVAVLLVLVAPQFQDPSPPEVRVLAPVEAPAAEPYPELTTHRAPRALPAGAVTEDWPGFLGARRDSRSRETKLLRTFPESGPPLLWEMRRGQGYASPVVVDGRVVFTHRVGAEVHIDCLDANTGGRFWRVTEPCGYRGDYIPDGGPRATPAVADGLVYVHGVDGILQCLELSTGRVVWRRELAREFALVDGFFGVVSSPLVVGDTLVVNLGATGGPCVAAFDRATGKLVWGSGKRWGASCASPVLGSASGVPRLFVVTGGRSRPATGGMMMLSPDDGTVHCEIPFRSRIYESVNASTPVVGDGWLFASASYGVGSVRFDITADDQVQQRWKKRDLGLQFSNPVLHDGSIYCIDGRSDRPGAVVKLDPETGAEVFRTDLNWDEQVELRGSKRTISMSIGEGSLLWADGAILCLGDNGHLLWLDLGEDGVTVRSRAWLFRANESWTPPVLSRGLLYVCQNKHERFGDAPPRLLCYDLRGSD